MNLKIEMALQEILFLFLLFPFCTGSVRIYDFISNRQLSEIQFKQGGTALTWAPRVVSFFVCVLRKIHKEPASIKKDAQNTKP